MNEIVFSALIGLMASIIHSTAGFGFSIITMMMFPLFFTLPESIVLKTYSGIIMVIGIVIRYRRDIDFKMLFWPLLLAVPGAIYGVISVTTIDNALAKKILGITLILLAVYSFTISDKIKVPATKCTALAGGGVAGLMGGFLGVPGPAIVLYYSMVLKKKEAYMGTVQTFFLIIDIITITFMSREMTFTPQIIKMTPIAAAASIVGMFLGGIIFKKLPAQIVHKVIYVVMSLAGVYYFF